MHAGAAGGLGRGLGVALGGKLAAPDRLVVAVEGDGSYMFCTPVSAHYVVLGQDTPFLTVIFNNQRWNEVRAATRHVYPDGVAARQGAYEALTHFHPSLQLHKVVEAAGGHGERVADPRELPAALERAIAMVTKERRQVVLDVICAS
jgi:acetolactate synthase-1/2/3 large subunit